MKPLKLRLLVLRPSIYASEKSSDSIFDRRSILYQERRRFPPEELRFGGVKLDHDTAVAKICIEPNLFGSLLFRWRNCCARSCCRMDDQANRPHRKTKEKKKKVHGGKSLAHMTGKSVLTVNCREKCQGLRRRQSGSPAEGSCAIQRCKIDSSGRHFNALRSPGQRKAPPCPTRRPPARRGAPNHCCSCWASRCTSHVVHALLKLADLF